MGLYESVSPSELSDIETSGGNLLYTDLLAEFDPDATLSELRDVVTAFQGTAHFTANRKEIYARFEQSDRVLEWIEQNGETATVTEAVAGIEAIIGTTLTAFVGEADFVERLLRTWDNLFAQIILPTDVNLREDLIGLLKTIQAIRLLEELGAGTETFLSHYSMKRAVLELPRSIFPLPTSALADSPGSGLPLPSQPDNTTFFEDVKKHEDAMRDLSNVWSQQLQELRLKNSSRKPAISSGKLDAPSLIRSMPESGEHSSLLNSDFQARLKLATTELLAEKDISLEKMTVPDVLEFLRKEVDGKWANDYTPPRVPGDVVVNGMALESDMFCAPNVLPSPCGNFIGGPLPTHGGIIPKTYVGDLLIVKKKLLAYRPGEVAHIENVLEGETRSREHEQLKRLEERSTRESERSTFEERDLQTTDRSSLESASSSVIAQQSQIQAGVSVSGSYGPVSMTANAEYGNSSSQTDSNQSALSIAREVVDRALKRVTERVREEKVRITIEQTIEKNVHSFINPSGNGNISGVYTWVDKLYLTRLHNYGKRLMMELSIPEPAAFYLYSMAQTQKNSDLIKPTPPALNSYQDVTASNYAILAAQYEAPDITPPPAPFIIVSEGVSGRGEPYAEGPTQTPVAGKVDIQIPNGYKAVEGLSVANSSTWIQAFLGLWFFGEQNWAPMNNETGHIPFTYYCEQHGSIYGTAEVRCVPTDEFMNEWKIKTYTSIMQGYQRKLSDYESKLAARQIQQGVSFEGNNPLINAETVRVELKKHVIELLSGQRFESFSAMRTNWGDFGQPEFLFNRSTQEAKYINFFEGAIEWENMTWQLHPYFWGRKPHWVDKMKMLKDQADPDFTKFLMAGAAKVLVPVRPEMSAALLHYMDANGEIWPTAEAPLVKPKSIQMMADLNTPPLGDAVPTAPWVVRVPTTLVALPTGEDEGTGDPIYSLPDYTENFDPTELDGVDLNP